MNNQMRFFKFFFYFLIQFNVVFGFNSLQELHLYTLWQEESPSIDNVDWTFPDFTTYYQSTKKGFIGRLAEYIGVSKPYWSIYQLQSLLTKVIESREKQKNNDESIAKIKTIPGQKYIIWGDLHGALHSLDRSLQYLSSQKIIDDNFIISEGYTFIFNGNAINRSSYSCETLTVILLLMDRNPDRVFYIQGTHEHKSYWKDETLTWELQVKGSEIPSKDTSSINKLIIKFFNIFSLSLFVPLEDLLIRFFDTLPLSLYLIDEQKKVEKIVQISGFESEDMVKKNKNLDTVQAYVLSENRRFSYNQTNGLIQLDDINGNIVWSVFSSPIQAHQELFDFFDDAFVMLEVADSIDNWTVQLVHRNIKSEGLFKTEQKRYLVSGTIFDKQNGQKIFHDVKQANIKNTTLGCTLDLSMGNAVYGTQIKLGSKLWMDYEKKENNEIPKIIYKDDKYNFKIARSNIENFLASGIDVIINSFVTGNIESYVDLIQSGKILLLFPLTGGYEFRNPDFKYIIHFKRGYVDESEVLLKYAHENLQANKYAIFYQNDSMGISALSGALKMKDMYNIASTNWLEVSYNKNDTWYESQYEKIKDFNPDIILFFSTAFVARNFIQQVGVDFFVGKRLLGISDLTEYSFMSFLQEKGLEFVVTSVVPDAKTSELFIAKLFRESAKKMNIVVDQIAFESYITTAIMMDMLKNIEGPITKESLVEYAQKYDNYDLHGLKITFNPKTRELSNAIWLYNSDNEWQKFEN